MPVSRRLLDAIPLNTKDISAERLNIESKERSNLFPWNGQFSPQFVEVLLEKYAASGARVLDPFCGSGTVLYECGRLGLSGTGIEVNPAAYLLARTYALCNITPEQRIQILNSLETRISSLFGGDSMSIEPGARDALESIGDQMLAMVSDASELEGALLETLVILADFYKGSSAEKLKKTWLRLRKIVEGLPYTQEPLQASIGDGRYPSKLEPFDLILTSPPYINVYNYHQQYRASVEALGWKPLEVARTEIGSNRKHRGNRFLTVIQYCLDLATALDSLWDVTTPTARLIFILGRESKVRGISFLNGEIFARLAIEAIGYEVTLRQERVFTNRFGQQIHEDIIHLVKGSRIFASEANARSTARESLEEVLLPTLNDDVRSDIEQAIEAVSSVQRSPRFDSTLSHKEKNLRTIYDLSNTTPRKAHGNTDKRQVATT